MRLAESDETVFIQFQADNFHVVQPCRKIRLLPLLSAARLAVMVLPAQIMH